MPDKVWFITGASRGFGGIWAEGALGRGGKVVATALLWARSPASPKHTAMRFCRWRLT